jgi:hypothetical protein
VRDWFFELRAAGTALATWIAVAVAMAWMAACAAERVSGAALDESTTKSELSRYAGAEPERCVFSGPDLELCSWRIDRSAPAWAALAEPLDVAADLNLLCELPMDGSPRAADSCAAYARVGAGLPPVSAGEGAAEGAEAVLREARTLRELAGLLGDAPDRCRTGPGFQTCAWMVGSDAPGYPLLAALASGLEDESPLRFECKLPLDGSARSSDSCVTVAAN